MKVTSNITNSYFDMDCQISGSPAHAEESVEWSFTHNNNNNNKTPYICCYHWKTVIAIRKTEIIIYIVVFKYMIIWV